MDKNAVPQRIVSGSNPLAAALVPSGNAHYPLCLVLRRGLKAVGPMVAFHKQFAF